jgi:electron transfer flavoprotein alpha subunit
MSGLVVDPEKCVGCGLCVRTCTSGGIEVTDRLAHVTDGCISCGMCVDGCPTGALAIQKEATSTDLASYTDVWVFAQQEAGTVAPVAFELLAKGREVAEARGCRLVAVLGEGTDAPDANDALLVAAGADLVIRCRDARLAANDAEVYARWIEGLVKERRPEVILYGATPFGRELAPNVAVRLRTGLTADCTVLDVDRERGLLQQTRPAFGGNLMATIVCPDHRPQMSTVRPGVFSAAEPDPGHAGTTVDVTLDADVSSRVRVLERIPTGSDASITDADTLVVVGRGIGSKKALPLMRELADLLGGKLGCTRPLVEAGWLDSSCQVGQTGVSVAPKLLVSVGVSGAIQHLAGIGGAERIVAINTDPSAAIFGVAQYAVVGDANQVVGELVKRLR